MVAFGIGLRRQDNQSWGKYSMKMIKAMDNQSVIYWHNLRNKKTNKKYENTWHYLDCCRNCNDCH